MWWRSALLLSAIALAAGCRGDMYDQVYVKPLAKSTFDPDQRSARRPPRGTVAQDEPAEPTPVSTGMQGGKPVVDIPVPVTPQLLARGRERFDIYCSPCHGRAGDGNGIVPQRGFQHPPSYHTDRLRLAPAGHFFDVITNGYGAMRSYADRVDTPDRWAIVAYIRALQVSQAVPASALPPADRGRIEGGDRGAR